QAAVAEGQYDSAGSARDVDLRLAAAGEAAQDSASHAARGRALVAPSDLPAVRVARKHEVNSGARGAAKDDGVVREQKLQLVRARAGERERQILQPDHRVVNAREPEGSATVFEAQALVDEHAYALGAEEVCD